MAHEHLISTDSKRRVNLALALTATFMLVEVAGGVLSGSLALLADAGHMLTDSMALALAAIAFRVASKPADSLRSYGYARFQILAAFINGLSLIAIVGWILYEAVGRFLQPVEIVGSTMLAVAAAGLLVNLLAFTILHGGDQQNLNIRGAAMHVVGDILGSVAAITAAIVVLGTGWTPIDPILSVVVAMLILRSAWHLVRRSGHILLEGVPEGLETAAIRDRLVGQLPLIGDIHHVHIWSLTTDELMLTMHVALKEAVADATPIVKQIKQILRDEFSIIHSTIEIECDDCADE